MGTCHWDGCGIPVTKPLRGGRPRKYCPVHAREAKGRQDAARRARVTDLPIPQCCRDWAKSGPRRKTCPQHQQWRLFTGRPAAFRSVMPSAWGAWDVEGGDLTVMLTLAEEGGYRISLHPDSYYPPESKRDQEADRKAEEFFRANAKPIVERVSRVPANWPPRYSTGWGLGWPPPFPPPPRYEFPLMTTAKTNEQ